jgi:hypothetical protein
VAEQVPCGMEACFDAGVLLGVFGPENWRRFISKRRSSCDGLHGVISPEMVLYDASLRPHSVFVCSIRLSQRANLFEIQFEHLGVLACVT